MDYNITDNAGLSKMAKDLTIQVLYLGRIGTEKVVTIDEWDLDRIYMTIDGKDYTIRTWDVRQVKQEMKVRWTLFVTVGDIESGTAHGEEICHGYSQFKIADYERKKKADEENNDNTPTEMELFLKQLGAHGIMERYNRQTEKLYPLACFDSRKGFFVIEPGEKMLQHLLLEQGLCSWHPVERESMSLAAMRKEAGEHERGKWMTWLNDWEEHRFYEFCGEDTDGEHTLIIALSEGY